MLMFMNISTDLNGVDILEEKLYKLTHTQLNKVV